MGFLKDLSEEMRSKRFHLEECARACEGIEDPEDTIPEMIKFLSDLDYWFSTEETFPLMHHGDEEKRLKLLKRCDNLLKKAGK